MPRPRNPDNEAQRSAQERWRDRIRKIKRPEVDAVDTAIAMSVAVFGELARLGPKGKGNNAKFAALKHMATNYLVAVGYGRDEAERMVYKRLHRDDVSTLSKMVINTSSKESGNFLSSVSSPPITA